MSMGYPLSLVYEQVACCLVVFYGLLTKKKRLCVLFGSGGF